MSDLAPLVAATLRDRVVKDQQEEINQLKRKVEQLEGTVQKKISRTVSVTGPGGSPVYSSGDLNRDGYDMQLDNVPRWMVELTPDR